MRRGWFARCILPASLFLLTLPAVAAESPSLLATQPKLLRMTAGDTFPFTLDPATGDHAEILLDSSAPGVAFALLAADGHTIETVTAEYPGWLTLSFPVSQSGEYRVVTKAVPANPVSVRISVQSFATVNGGSRRRAEELFSSAQSLLHSPNAAGLHQAIENDTHAASAWAQAGDREGQVLALASEARAWMGLSEHDKAIAALTRAISLCAPTSFWHALLANLQAQVYLDRWEKEPARKNAEDALQLSRVLHDDWLTADALAERGESSYLTHDPAAAKDIQESLRMAHEINAIATLARAQRCDAWLEKDQGHLNTASVRLDQARGYFHQAGDIRAEMQVMVTLSDIASTTGDPYTSLLRHNSLANLLHQSGATASWAIALDDLAYDYLDLNRTKAAVLYFQQALAAFRSIHHTAGEELVLSSLCTTEKQLNRKDEALRDCRSSAAIVKQFNDPKRSGVAAMRLGQVQQAFGQIDLAIANFRHAVELSESVNDSLFTAEALLNWGDALAGSSTDDEADKLYRTALRLGDDAHSIPLQIEARYRIAQTEFDDGHDEAAKRTLDVALASIAVQRSSVGDADLQAAYFAQVRKCHDLYVDILMSEQQRDPSSGAAAKALEVSESGRALTLLDTLAARDAASNTEQTTSATPDTRKLEEAVEKAYDQRLKLMLEGAHKPDLDGNAAQLTQAIDALERAEDEKKAEQKAEQKISQSPSAPAGRTLSSAQIAAAADPHSTLIEYMLGSSHSYAWVIAHGKIESHVLPPRDQIAALVKQWRELATTRTRPGETAKDLPEVAAKLSCMLLGDFVRPDTERLVVVPDGELHLLPFAAMPENGCAHGKDPIILAHRVLLTPSLSIFLSRPEASTQTTYPGLVAVLADPVFDRDDSRVLKNRNAATGGHHPQFAAPVLPRLFETGTEAHAIVDGIKSGPTALYLGFDANLQTLLSPALRDYKILHLATHGVLDEEMPDFSGIVLSLVDRDGKPIHGYLKAHDIEALNLRSDLVVLSSCDSAAGINLSGEGIRGLNHAFLSAGARRVVSTLWSVDDTATRNLMVSFYTGMLTEGLDPAEALRRSQMKMIRNPRTAAPYFWAAFNITSTVN